MLQRPIYSIGTAPAPVVKVAFFDLDNTLITQCEKLDDEKKEANQNLYRLYKNKKLGTTAYTTYKIIGLLVSLTRSPDCKWYVVSKGGNVEIFEALRDLINIIVEGEGAVDIRADFGVRDKGTHIEKILDGLEKEYKIEQSIFVDDQKKYRDQVRVTFGITDDDAPNKVKIITFDDGKGGACAPGDVKIDLTLLDDDTVDAIAKLMDVDFDDLL